MPKKRMPFTVEVLPPVENTVKASVSAKIPAIYRNEGKDGEEVYEILLRAARRNSVNAAAKLLDKWYPNGRTMPISLPDMPDIRSPEDLFPACAYIVGKVKNGEITTEQASFMLDMLDRCRVMFETTLGMKDVDRLKRQAVERTKK